MLGLDAAFWLGVATFGLAGVAGLAWRRHRRVAQARRQSRADLAVLESAVDALTRRVTMIEQQLRGPGTLPAAANAPPTLAAPAPPTAFMAADSARPVHGIEPTVRSHPINRQAPSDPPVSSTPPAPFVPPDSAHSAHPDQSLHMGGEKVDIEGLARRIDALRSRPIDDSTPESPAPAPSMDGSAQPDDLTLIDGIDAAVQKALNDAGFRTFRDIVAATPEELAWALAAAGPILAGTRTDHWPAQARRLAGARGVESR